MSSEVSPIYIEKGDIAVLMFHGFTSSPQSLEGLAKFLARGNYTVYVPLLPGHGTTPEDLNRVKWMDWISVAEKAYQELRGKDFKRIFIFGHSMGGIIALRMGELHADIDGIITTAAPINIKGFLIKLVPFLKHFVKFIKKKRNKQVRQRFFSYDVWPISAIHELLKLVEVTKRELKSIISPLLLIQGTDDELVPLSAIDTIYSNVSSKIKRRLILEGVGHGIPYSEKAEIVYEEILKFIREVSKD